MDYSKLLAHHFILKTNYFTLTKVKGSACVAFSLWFDYIFF